MAQMVERKTATPSKDILLAPHLAFTIGVVVSNTGVATVDGKKIIPAGTPLGATENVLLNRGTTLKVDATNAQGVLRNDVDVTNGNTNAELVVSGVVDASKCPTSLDATAQAKLTKITFVNGGKQ